MGRKVRVSQNSLNNYNSKLSNSSLCSCHVSVIFTKQSRREKKLLKCNKGEKKEQKILPGKRSPNQISLMVHKVAFQYYYVLGHQDKDRYLSQNHNISTDFNFPFHCLEIEQFQRSTDA